MREGGKEKKERKKGEDTEQEYLQGILYFCLCFCEGGISVQVLILIDVQRSETPIFAILSQETS